MVMMFTVVEAGLEIVKGIVGKIVRIDKVAICGLVTRWKSTDWSFLRAKDRTFTNKNCIKQNRNIQTCSKSGIYSKLSSWSIFEISSNWNFLDRLMNKDKESINIQHSSNNVISINSKETLQCYSINITKKCGCLLFDIQVSAGDGVLYGCRCECCVWPQTVMSCMAGDDYWL